ncbi:conjugative transfer relaxase/helicase TraI domain-containing protein [Klebsiella pneumoniae]|uniref:conjugative transfer relaxase/helicase TraI domain-containing protein n=1 Tax=Klebsiella pneumoniae TaxID=573 RepID=UPI00389049B2
MSPGKSTLSRTALPAFDKNGKAAGIWLSPLTDRDGRLEAIGERDELWAMKTPACGAAEQLQRRKPAGSGNMGRASEWLRDNPG